VYRSRGRRVQRAQNVQQRALPRAGLAHYGHHLAGLNIEVKPAKEGEGAARRRVSLFEIANLNDGDLAGMGNRRLDVVRGSLSPNSGSRAMRASWLATAGEV